MRELHDNCRKTRNGFIAYDDAKIRTSPGRLYTDTGIQVHKRQKNKPGVTFTNCRTQETDALHCKCAQIRTTVEKETYINEYAKIRTSPPRRFLITGVYSQTGKKIGLQMREYMQ